MLKINLENLGKIRLLEDEKKGLEKVLKYANEKGYELYLFGSRLNGFGADIDLAIKGENITFKDVIYLQGVFALLSDTKLDIIEYDRVEELTS